MTATPLFLVGVGRSGTTALAEVFSDHPRVVMGMERYKGLWGPRLTELTRERLERERFLDFSDDLTNVRPDVHERWERYYAKQADRFETAAYVGDKMTTARFERVWEHLPDARFLCIVRAAEEVASSWDVRARRTDDPNWPARLDSKRAIEAWNAHNQKIRRARRHHPDLVAVVEYEDFFGDPDARALRAALDWLGLDPAPEIEASFAAAHEVYVSKVRTHGRTLEPEARAFVEEHAAPDLWKHLTKLAL